MQMHIRKKHSFNRTLLAALAGGLTLTLTAAADPISDLRSLSTLKDVDLSRLSGGTVAAAGQPLGSFARGMSVQSAYVVQAPVRSTVLLIQQWNPTRYPRLRIYLQGDVSAGVGPQSFRSLAAAPSNSSVRAFFTATEKLPADASKLQLSNAEEKQYSDGGSGSGGVSGPALTFWSQVLAERAKDFISGGINAEPAYKNGISPASEVARLIESSGNIQSHFTPIISGGRGTPSLSWQLFDADGEAAVSLDAFYAKSVDDGYQTLDIGFYSSGGFYAVVTLQQLWPVQINGRDATLVWRVDLVSSSSFDSLRGVQRLGSGAAVMRNIQENVKTFIETQK
jgi:hypothetical protein